MSEISKHVIGGRNGPVPLLDWVKDHKYRNYASFNAQRQLECAKKIAAVEDGESRKLLLAMLSEAAHLQELCEEMHKEFDTLHAALSKIDENTKEA